MRYNTCKNKVYIRANLDRWQLTPRDIKSNYRKECKIGLSSLSYVKVAEVFVSAKFQLEVDYKEMYTSSTSWATSSLDLLQ